jgi:23S rRNA (guanosine2251-2'-O)-methyltransferase
MGMKQRYGDRPRSAGKGRPAPGPDRRRLSHGEWIYGLNPVLEAVRSGRDVKSVIVSSSRREGFSAIEKEVLDRGVRLRREDASFFESRFPKGHQGIAAVVAPRVYATVEDLLDVPSRKNEVPLFLILDLIEDPRNFGAILRVADAGGVHGVVIQSHRSVTLGPEAVKASAGAAEYMPVAMVANIKHAMREMKEAGIIVAGAEADAPQLAWKADFSIPTAIVVGSEGKGLRKTVKEDCDMLVKLPMKGRVNSLNASVATGIIIFEIMRQRTGRNE